MRGMDRFVVRVSIACAAVVAAGTLLVSLACDVSTFSPTVPIGPNRVAGSGVLGQRSVDVGGFTTVDHRGLGRLFIDEGSPEGLVMSGDQNILPFIEVQVVGDALEISTRAGVSLDPTIPIEYQLTAANLRGATLQGVGDIECDGLTTGRIALEMAGVGNLKFTTLDVEELSLNHSGVGGVRTSGSAIRQELFLTGVGDYRGHGFRSEIAEVEISGVGSATVRVSDRLVARVQGSGCVYYIGSPVVEADITGSGCVEKIGG